MNNTRIKDIPLVDRPRERLLLYGVSNLSNEELLSIILKTGNKNESVKSISNNVLSTINDITELKDKSIKNLTNIKGIGEVKAITLLASIELGKRVYNDSVHKLVQLNNSKKVFDYMKDMKKFIVYALGITILSTTSFLSLKSIILANIAPDVTPKNNIAITKKLIFLLGNIIFLILLNLFIIVSPS